MQLVVAGIVYGLCLLTSLVCAALVLASWFRSRTRFLFWTGAAFVLLSINNLILLLDRVILLSIDFWPWRQIPAVLAVLVLLYGFSRRVE
ncbi:MAG TPA: DUF5985 family protein [Caulobacteraceae bacterium]|nr:DUF5985 family protein [Caulobacteraceae bacterium]